MPQQKIETEKKNIYQQVNASFTLAGYLLEAQDETATILAAMRVGNDLLGAEGCVFVPFNEWKQSISALKYGEISSLKDENWQECLSTPGTRQACRVCEGKQAGPDCVLLHEPAGDKNVFCISLRCDGREVGVVSYFFLVPPLVNEDQHIFLAEMVRLTDLALGSLRWHEQQLEATRRAFASVGLKKKLVALNAKNGELLEQLEYKAVLDERTRLAREIHDGLAQTLAFLKLEAGRMQTYISKGELDSVTRTLQACYQTLSDAYLDARQAIDDLRRAPDETLGDWLEMTAIDFHTLTDLTVDVSNVRLSHMFPSGIKVQLIRIVQEALTNIRKHAQASTVIISALEREGEAILEVHDNGCGFSPGESKPISQYGLRSMRERADSIEADFQIVSSPGAGTTVSLRIPIRENASL